MLMASPDGIIHPLNRTKETHPLVGRMVEIKCPTSRKITTVGAVKGDICPIQYWCQIQQQLECLDLDECDFVQCNFERYKNREEWLNDEHQIDDYLSAESGQLKGAFIELMPCKLDETHFNVSNECYKDSSIWNLTKIISPPNIKMNAKKYDKWLLSTLESIPKGYTVRKITYWRLREFYSTLVLRDKEWFNNQMPTYTKMWGYLQFLKYNPDMAKDWTEWIEQQPTKYNDKILKKLDDIIMKYRKAYKDIPEGN
jgi:hypothetical protein